VYGKMGNPKEEKIYRDRASTLVLKKQLSTW
jgi:hypothetical protein